MKYLCKFIIAIFLFNAFYIISYADSPSISAESAIVIDLKTGRVLYEKNSEKQLPMASTTKILTALVAMENGDLDGLVKVSDETTNIEGSSIYLKAGETMTLRDLLYGLMLCSGNDAACTIAKHIGGGSIEKFIQMMNEKAYDIGAFNSLFKNPHGLHDSNHYTTAHDLALITQEAMKNDTFKKIVGTKLWIAEREGDRYKYFYNKNKVLSQYTGGTGVKIGYTRAAGRCLVASGKKDNMEVICVVLNDSNWFNDAYRLMDYAFNKYEPFKVINKNQIFKTIEIKNGTKEQTKIIAAKDVIIPLTELEKREVSILFSLDDQLVAPINRKEKIGLAKIYLRDQILDTVDIITREDIEYESANVFDLLKITINKIKK